jgi:hypothetical protein
MTDEASSALSEMVQWTDVLYTFYRSARLSKFDEKQALILTGEVARAFISKAADQR